MVLQIKSRNDIPFGSLTLEKNVIFIDGKEFKTPCHYILSSMFDEGLIKESIKQARIENIFDKYVAANEKTILKILSCSIPKYLKCKSQNKKFVTDLLETGDKKLFCDFFPKNIYGKFLEQARFRLQVTNDDPLIGDRSNDPIFYMYLAEKALKEILLENNLQDLIDQNFLRMSDLLRWLEKKYGKERIFKKAPNRSTILQIHKQRNVDFTTNPTSLIKLVRRQNIRKCFQINENKVKYIIYDLFIQYYKHLHPAKLYERDQIIIQEKETIPLKITNMFIQRMWSLYKDNQLPQPLTNQIKDKIKAIYLPSDEEISKYEKEIFPMHPGQEKQEIKVVDIIERNSGDTWIIPKSSILSCFSNDDCIINNYCFKTIIHYCVFKLILSEKNVTESKVHQKIHSLKIEELFHTFHTWSEKVKIKKLNEIVYKCLILFFKNEEMQFLLLSLGNETIQMDCNWFPNLANELDKFKFHLQPKIFKLSSLEQLKQLPIISKWILEQKNYIFTLKLSLENWLKNKQCFQVCSIQQIIKFFFCNLQKFQKSEEYINHILSFFKKFKTDLQLYDYIFKMQYIYSTQWIQTKNIVSKPKYDAIVTALCNIIIVFDKLTSTKIIIDENDVDFALNILLDKEISEHEEIIQEENEVQSSEEEEIDYKEELLENEFEGNDDIYQYLFDNCHNTLSDYIEIYISDSVKKILVTPILQNRINFFCGTLV